jgi:beta-glucosidase
VADGDGPAWNVTPQDGALDYVEGTRVGYRGWYGSDVEPAFWFGAGLGWGVWDYRTAEPQRSSDGESLAVVLANTADRPSREVVQVYWQPEGSAPVRLVGYAIADEMLPVEERRVAVACDLRAFRLWDEAASGWTMPPGGTFLGERRRRRRLPSAMREQRPNEGSLAAPAAAQAGTLRQSRGDPHR